MCAWLLPCITVADLVAVLQQSLHLTGTLALALSPSRRPRNLAAPLRLLCNTLGTLKSTGDRVAAQQQISVSITGDERCSRSFWPVSRRCAACNCREQSPVYTDELSSVAQPTRRRVDHTCGLPRLERKRIDPCARTGRRILGKLVCCTGVAATPSGSFVTLDRTTLPFRTVAVALSDGSPRSGGRSPSALASAVV